MERSLYVRTTIQGVQVALLEDDALVELHEEQNDKAFSVGDFYLGKVKRLKANLNAAFVDIGHEKDAFLHYHDLGPQLKSFQGLSQYHLRSKRMSNPMLDNARVFEDINKHGKIGEVLRKGQEILVKVEKEPISTKGPRLSCEFSLPGRYLVLVPFSEDISISKKITTSQERKRLKVLLSSIKPQKFGVIVRTAAEGVSVSELDRDMRDLVDKWKNTIKELHGAKSPKRVHQEMSRTTVMLRELLNEDFANIIVDSDHIYKEVKNYIGQIFPGKEKIAKLFKGKGDLFTSIGIDRQIKKGFGQTVNMSSGSYLVIEHTEALHVIDVNSGSRLTPGDDREANIFKVNLESAKEIARQLRLRDMGGIIVVDFIDMRSAGNRRELYNQMKDFMKGDRAKHTVLQVSRFGLMQLTRQRVRPEIDITTAEKCPTCNGTGTISASILITDEIEAAVKHIFKELNESNISLRVHPYVAAYLTKGISSIQRRWLFAYMKRVKVISDQNYHIGEFTFFNSSDEEISLS